MGRHFTFQLIIRKIHKFIETGPYKFVRHPSYTTLTLSVIGFNFFVYAYGWDRCIEYLAPSCTIAWRETCGYIIRVIVVLVSAIVCKATYDRSKREDKMMRVQFEDEREGYAAKTRAFIPYVL